MTREERANHCRQLGTLGGSETARRYGPKYMKAIAAIGFATTTDRYYAGSRAHARAALIERRRHFSKHRDA
jgi:hypothetical protein